MKRLTLGFCSVLLSALVHGQIIHVPADQPTIQAGINAAADGDTVLVDPGTYIENVNFNGKNITVASLFLTTLDTSYISQTIIDANENGTAVIINTEEDSTTLLCGFTIQNGYSIDWDGGGGIYCEDSSPKLKHLIIRNNSARLSGGIRCENASLTLANVQLSDNYSWSSSGSGGLGGGLYSYNSEVSINDCKIIANSAGTLGGGVYCEYSTLNLSNVVIQRNTATHPCEGGGRGGGIYCINSDILLTNVSINNNFSGNAGGLWSGNSTITFDSIDLCNIYLNRSPVTRDLISDTFLQVNLDTFSVIQPTSVFASPIQNFAFSIQHGIIQQENADLFVSPDGNNSNSGLNAENPLKTIEHAFCKIMSDSVDRKTIHLLDGIYSPSSNGELFPVYMIEDVDLVGTADSLAILDAEGQDVVLNLVNNFFNVSRITITGGFKWGYGGGIRCFNMTGNLTEIIIKNNHGNYGGGGICLEDSNPILTNVKIAGNTTSMSGSGIWCNYSNPVLINTLISDNHGGIQNGSALALFSSNPHIINTTIVNNEDKGMYCQNSSNPVLINSILWGHEGDAVQFGSVGSANSITVSYSDIEGGEEGINTNSNGSVNWLDGNMDEDPFFTGSGNHPYGLSVASPCIDAGTPDTTGLNLPECDIIGCYRIWDGDGDGIAVIDMGAYEFDSPVVGISKPVVAKKETKLTVYPNPFHSSTTIEFELKAKTQATLQVYNHMGQQVAELLNESKAPGNHQLTWNAAHLPPGLYFLRLQAGNEVRTGKVIKY
jgi:hypothetical protein